MLYFHNLFKNEVERIVSEQKAQRGRYELSKDDLADEHDLFASERDTTLLLRLHGRQAQFLKKVGEALDRLEAGTFGQCASCDEAIEARRLEARPTTTLCVSCKEEEELREHLHADSRSKRHALRIA